jgi:hypothetical protein
MPDIRFWACSGSEHMQGKTPADSLETGGLEILNFATGAGTAVRNRIGFFGAGGIGTPIVINTYQDTTFPTNAVGTTEGPPLVQNKYTGVAAQVQMSGAWTASTEEVGAESGTVQVRFTEPGAIAVQTQNAFMEAVLIKDDTVQQQTEPNNIIIQAFECQHPFGTTITQSTWLEIAGSSPPADFQIDLTAQNWLTPYHDFFLALSVAPTAVGANPNFGFYVQLEYL